MVALPTVGVPAGGTVDTVVARNGDNLPIARAPADQVPADSVERGRPRANNGPAGSGPRPDAPGAHPRPDVWTRIGSAVAAFSVVFSVGAMLAMGPLGWGVLAASAVAGLVAAKATDNYLMRGSIFPLFGGGAPQVAAARTQPAPSRA
jgi:hypothetical protein